MSLEAESYPGLAVVLGVPAAAAYCGQYVIIFQLIAADIFLDAGEIEIPRFVGCARGLILAG